MTNDCKGMDSMALLPERLPSRTEDGTRLALFANRDAQVLFDHLHPTVEKLVRQHRKGVYDPTLALKTFQRVAVAAALIYEETLGESEGRCLTFSPEDHEDAGAQLLLLNAHLIAEGIEATKRREEAAPWPIS